jgi:hypothetical protein
MAIEEARYHVLEQDGKFEIRDYTAHVIAETLVLSVVKICAYLAKNLPTAGAGEKGPAWRRPFFICDGGNGFQNLEWRIAAAENGIINHGECLPLLPGEVVKRQAVMFPDHLAQVVQQLDGG